MRRRPTASADEFGGEAGTQARCQEHLDAGGWGTATLGYDNGGDWIPSRNVFIMNNIFYNPPGSGTHYVQFVINGAITPAAHTANIPNPSSVPGANAYVQNLLRGYRGLAAINQNTTEFYDTYHSIQTSFQLRFQNGFSAGINYTLGLVLERNPGQAQRHQHNADGIVQCRADQGQYEELFKQLTLQQHVVKARHTAGSVDVIHHHILSVQGSSHSHSTDGVVLYSHTW